MNLIIKLYSNSLITSLTKLAIITPRKHLYYTIMLALPILCVLPHSVTIVVKVTFNRPGIKGRSILLCQVVIRCFLFLVGSLRNKR